MVKTCLLTILLLLVGCSGSPKKSGGPGELVVPYAINSIDGTTTELQCKFKFKSAIQVHEVDFVFKKTLSYLRTGLPSGDYTLEEISCKTGQTWSEVNGFKFAVHDGRAAVMEPLQIQSSKKVLKVSSSPGPKEQHEMIKSALRDLRPLNGKNLISAYTQKPLTDAVYIVEKSKYDRGGLVYLNGAAELSLQDVSDLGYTYDKCGRDEAQKNKLRIGIYELIGFYEKGHLRNVEVFKTDSLYSTSYENCVRLKVADFKPFINERLRQAYKISDKFQLTFRF